MIRRPYSKIAGFTIVEMMVVVSVLAILAMVAIPSFIETIRQNRLVSQSNEVLSVLFFARSEAIKRREAIEVEFSESPDGGWTAVVRDAANAVLRVSDHTGSNTSLSNYGILTFSQLGRLDDNESIAITQSGTASRLICVGMTGRARVVKGEACS